MRIVVTLTLSIVYLVFAACSSIPDTHQVGAVCAAERTITLYQEPKTPKTPKDLMKMTVGQVRVGEMYEVLKRQQERDSEKGITTAPFWLYIASKERPQLRGWALADPIAAKRLNQ